MNNLKSVARAKAAFNMAASSSISRRVENVWDFPRPAVLESVPDKVVCVRMELLQTQKRNSDSIFVVPCLGSNVGCLLQRRGRPDNGQRDACA